MSEPVEQILSEQKPEQPEQPVQQLEQPPPEQPHIEPIYNVVLISPHFPPNFYLFCQALAKIPTVRVLAISDCEYSELRKEIQESLTRYYKVSSLENYDEVLKGVAFFIHNYGKIHRLESHNEHWLELDARLRKDFNIPGLKPKRMDCMKKKSKMKEKFIEAGLRVARGTKAFSKNEALQFAAEVGYPMVAKPDKGVGALATYKIEKETDFDQVQFESGYFLEEFITGTIVTYDGLVDNTGEIVFAASHEYSAGILEVTTQNTHIYYYSQRIIPEDIEDAGRKIVDIFQLKERFFHFEFFRTKEPGKCLTQTTNGVESTLKSDIPKPDSKDVKKDLFPANKSTLVCLEVNMRPPGGYTLDMFNYANDVDLYSVWSEMITTPPDFKLKRPLTYSRPYHVCYLSRKKHIKYKHSPEEVAKHKLAKTIVFSGEVHPGLSLMGDYFFVTRSEELQELLDLNKYLWEVEK